MARLDVLDISSEKFCPGCEQTLPLSAFRTRILRGQRKPVSRCEPCDREYQRRFAEKRRAKGYKYEYPPGPRVCIYCNDTKGEGEFASASVPVCKLCNREKAREWRAKNPKRARASADAWRKKNPLRAKLHRVHRRSLKKGSIGYPALADVQRLLARFLGKCAYCETEDAVELDHVVPLTKGGSNYIGNLLPVCRSCNAKKYNKLLIAWKAEVYHRSS